MLRIALVNLKPGVGKTTGAVWLAHAFAERGHGVLLVDADPSGSALRWSDLAGGFPVRVVGLPVRDLHARVDGFADPSGVVVVDAPQLEDHAGIARSALRWADEVVIPVAPTPIEVDRTAPVRREVEDLEAVRVSPARVCVLLNRVVTGASSGAAAREVLTEDGYDVLAAVVPRREVFAQSFGGPVKAGGTAYADVAAELAKRAGVAW